MRRPMIVALLLVVSVALPAAAQQNGREHWVATWAVAPHASGFAPARNPAAPRSREPDNSDDRSGEYRRPARPRSVLEPVRHQTSDAHRCPYRGSEGEVRDRAGHGSRPDLRRKTVLHDSAWCARCDGCG